MSERIELFSNLLGYVSLGWFIWLLFGRYDHYGKVCSGDYLEDRKETTSFANLQTAGHYIYYYILAIMGFVMVLFFGILLYSYCADTVRVPVSEEKKQENHDE